MKNTTQGFTLIELLIVIAIIGILAAVLIPNLLGARAKGNDAAADSVARQTLNAMAAIEVGNNAGATVSGCTLTNGVLSFALTTGSDATKVNAPAPVTGVTCSSDATEYKAIVTYTGGSSGRSPLTRTAAK